MNRLSEKKPHLINLMLLAVFANVALILLSPGFPQISHEFNLSTGSTQLIVTSFLIGYALGQLIYGPLANRFGRKPTLYISISIAMLGTLCGELSGLFHNFNFLIAAQFLQAVGSTGGLAISYTIIHDYYPFEKAKKITGVLMFSFAIMPGLANLAGGILVAHFNWQSCFHFLFIYEIGLLLCVSLLPETHLTKDFHALQYKNIFRNYLNVLLNKKFVGYSLLIGLTMSNIYIFGAAAPFISDHWIHLTALEYGFCGLMPNVGVLIGCILITRFTTMHHFHVLITAFFLELIASIAMFYCFLNHDITFLSLSIPIIFLGIGHPMLTTTAISLAMNEVSDKANASAAANFSALSIAVIFTFLLSLFSISYAWIMPLFFLLSLCCMLLVYGVCIKNPA